MVRRIYAARGIGKASDCDYTLARLLPPDGMLGLDCAADLLADAVREGRRICIAGDYDADGATSTALLCRGFAALGAKQVRHVIPDRFTMGYGLSVALVERAAEMGAEVLVTVDSGIASLSGVAHARARGMTVIVTDHHLPGSDLPAAHAIVNPNQPGDTYPSKCLAGVGVAFYLLAALRNRLGRERLALPDLLDLVALGTVADVVPLDHNNRVLVAQGLARIRAGRASHGINALLTVAKREPEHADASALGFVVGPRLNAAGRLEDMGQGVACLLSSDDATAMRLAAGLDRLNRERREIESDMLDGAFDACLIPDAVGLCLYDDSWHEGVIGLVASRVRQSRHRPVVVFAPANDGQTLKGSARSVPALHVRDVLAEVNRERPGLIERFGGHAMAAGLSLDRTKLMAFAECFDAVCGRELSAADLEARLDSDGPLAAHELDADTALAIEAAGPWGQAFPEPVFDDVFLVHEARVVGERHMRYRLTLPGGGSMLRAIHFGGADSGARVGAQVHVAYQLAVDRWQGRCEAQLMIRDLRALAERRG